MSYLAPWQEAADNVCSDACEEQCTRQRRAQQAAAWYIREEREHLGIEGGGRLRDSTTPIDGGEVKGQHNPY